MDCSSKRVRGVESTRANDRCVLWATIVRLRWWTFQAVIQHPAPALAARSCDHSCGWGHNAQDPTWAGENLRCYFKCFLDASHFFHVLLINFSSLQIPPFTCYFTSDVLTCTKHFLGSSPPRCVLILNHHGDVLSTTWADTQPSGGPLGARIVPRVDEWGVLMEKKALLEQKVGSEDVLWLAVLTNAILGLTVTLFPRAVGGLEVRCVAGVGSAHVFLRNLLLYLPSVWQKH